MLRVLITGGTGLLGKSLIESVPRGFHVYATYYRNKPLSDPTSRVFQPMDVRNPVQVQDVFDWAQPDVVIHSASVGSVDYAEKNRQETWDINVGGTKNVLQACTRRKAKMVFISSNAVFSGEHPFYGENDTVRPINYYGHLKVAGEQAVAQEGVEFSVVRPILMYGWPKPGGRPNPVTWWIASLEQGETIKVVDDVYSKPLLALNCAEAIWALIRKEKTGIYHVAGLDHATLYQFALETARVFRLDENLIEPVPSSYFPGIAPRPRDTSFVTTKMEKELGVKPISIRDGLLYLKHNRRQST